MKLLTQLFIATIAVLISSYILPGVHVESLTVAIVVAVVLGMLNMFIKPVLVFLTLPITVVTLGLFMFVINIALVLLAEYVIPGFSIDTLLTAFLFSILLSLTNTFLTTLLK